MLDSKGDQTVLLCVVEFDECTSMFASTELNCCCDHGFMHLQLPGCNCMLMLCMKCSLFVFGGGEWVGNWRRGWELETVLGHDNPP